MIREFPARLVRAVDGDTQYFCLDTGFNQTITVDIRLANINCPELATPAGMAAREAAQAWLRQIIAAPGSPPSTSTSWWPFTLRTAKVADNYGRYIAIVLPAAGGESLNDYLVRTKNAVPFDVGRGGL